MGHKTLIGGTAYEISGGKTLVGGTAYSIDKGKTLIGGTAHEISFVIPPFTLTVTGAGSNLSASRCYITINGDNSQKYAGGSGTSWPITIDAGSFIRCSARAANDSGKHSYIYVNGTLVVSNEEGVTSTYDYYPEPGASVTVDIRGNSSSMDKTITITTS